MFWLSSSLQDDMQSGDDAENGDDMPPTMGGPEPMYAVEVLSGCSTEMQDACETQSDVHLHDQPTGMSVEKPTAKCAAKKKAKRKVSGDDVKPKTPRAKAKGPNKTAAKAKVSPCAKASAKAKAKALAKKASPKTKAMAKRKPAPKTNAKKGSNKIKDEVERKMHSVPKLFQTSLL